MNLFRKFFGSSNNSSNEDKDGKDYNPYLPEVLVPVDELFPINFKKNGGKFLYCENLDELREQFLNILEENDWFECEAMCLESFLFGFLEENKLSYKDSFNPKFLFASCENLIADEGSILFSSKQIKQNKPSELPDNIVIFAKTSQMVRNKSDGLRQIQTKYRKEYPTNISTIKYFEKAQDEDFLQYGSSPKNLYLLLLENL